MKYPAILFVCAGLATSALAADLAPPPPGDPLTVISTKAQSTKCLNNAKQLVVALLMFISDHDGDYPVALDELKTYLKVSPDKFPCPFDPKKAGCGYEFLLSGKKLSAILDPAATPMLRAKFAGPDGRRTVAFADGHVEAIKDGK